MRARAIATLLLALAQPAWAGSAEMPGAEVLRQHQARAQRLQDVGWQLVRGNAPFCADTKPSIGLTLLDSAGFGSPRLARTALSLDRDIVVHTAAAGSPAALAGITPFQGVTAIAGEDPNLWPARDRLDWQRLTRAHDAIDTTLAENGAVELAFSTAQSPLVIAGLVVCGTRFELASSDDGAAAEGSRVLIGEDFDGFAYPDDQLAAALAHELAHNLLHHRAWLDNKGRKRKNVRLTEREADRLMPWLLANADFDPRAAVRFMQQWGPRHDAGIFRARTHDGWDERLEMVSAEAALVEAQMRDHGAADWKLNFRREISD